MISKEETNNLSSINNVDFLRELYQRVKVGEITIRVRKWKSKMGGINKVKVVFIGDKEYKNFLISHSTEGQEFYRDGKLVF